MYGSYETARDQAEHLRILREIQDETHGFTELVTLPFVHTNTPLYRQGIARPGPTGREDLLMIAVSRLFLDNFDNIQVAWGKVGLKMTQLALLRRCQRPCRHHVHGRRERGCRCIRIGLSRPKGYGADRIGSREKTPAADNTLRDGIR